MTPTRVVSSLALFAVALSAVACATTASPDESATGVDTAPQTATSQDRLGGSFGTDTTRKYLAYINGNANVNGVNKSIACMGTFISSRVVLTAGHCIKNITNLKVNAPNVNTTWTSPQTAFTHDDARFDVGVLILASAAPGVTTFPKIYTAENCANVGSSPMSAWGDDWYNCNKFGRTNGAGTLMAKPEFGGAATQCTSDSLYFGDGHDPGGPGDSGGAYILIDQNNNRSTEAIHGIQVAGVNYVYPDGYTANDTVLLRVQWIRPWLERIKTTNAYVASAAYTTVPPNMVKYIGIEYGASVVDTWDIWRLVQ